MLEDRDIIWKLQDPMPPIKEEKTWTSFYTIFQKRKMVSWPEMESRRRIRTQNEIGPYQEPFNVTLPHSGRQTASAGLWNAVRGVRRPIIHSSGRNLAPAVKAAGQHWRTAICIIGYRKQSRDSGFGNDGWLSFKSMRQLKCKRNLAMKNIYTTGIKEKRNNCSIP